MTATERNLFEAVGSHELSRRDLLKASGAVIVGFSLLGPGMLQPGTAAAQYDAVVSGDLLDSWLAIDAEGKVTLFTGKVELGTGVQTALAQIAAEELDVGFERMAVVQGDTALTVDQGATVGSQTITRGGPQVRQAAAEARLALLQLASERLGAPVDALTVEDGVISVAGEPLRQVSYGELVGGKKFETVITEEATPKDPSEYSIVGRPIQRMDIPEKVTGAPIYVQDVRLPGMLHARSIKPPSIGSMLESVDEDSIRDVPGVVKVVVKGNFVAVVAQREEQAIEAADRLKVNWSGWSGLPTSDELYRSLRTTKSVENTLRSSPDIDASIQSSARMLQATYLYPYQTHGSIGPSCAVADVRDDRAVIYSPADNVHDLRGFVAELLGMSVEQVRLIWREGAGSYGKNGAADATADAALVSQAVGAPVRLQWMRKDEHRWANAGPAMAMDLRAGLDARGNVTAWDYQAYTPSHFYRDLLTERLVNRKIAAPDGPPETPAPWGGESQSVYSFPEVQETIHQVQSAPLRSHPLRAPGQVATTFATESFTDEMAAAAGADPIDFRLRHLTNERAIAVLKAVAERADWNARPSPKSPGTDTVATGRGVALVQRGGTFVGMVVEADVNRESGAVSVKHVVVAHDCGLIINPDGLRNQIEGNVVQTLSRALKEELTFDDQNVTSIDWDRYPILTFKEVPQIDIVLINRPDLPASGAGEPSSCPVTAAVGNAIFDAVGVRLREAPFTQARVQQALA